MGWVAGPVVLLLFAFVTYYTSSLLADCYRHPDPVTGKRNYTYMDAVKANLGTYSAISLTYQGQDTGGFVTESF